MTRTLTRTDTLNMIRRGMIYGGETIHLPGSMHDRFIVGGMAPEIRVPGESCLHPATIAYVTDKLNAALRDYPRAETVGSWLDLTTGHIYFDLGSTHAHRDTAMHVAGLRGELAIYDSTAETEERAR